jgi:crotonobetainyl-CoA:carnitine CoA-transferase CaiB-like acyl-CoA transferase
LAELVGKPDLPKDPYVTTAGKREEEQPGIDQTHRGAVLDIQEVGDAVAFLQNYRIMAAPVLSVTEIFGEAPR